MNNLPTPPFSMVREAGNLIFISGQLAPRDGKIVGKDIATQTHLVIDAIERQLAPLGLNLSNIVKTSAWIVSKSDFPEFNSAYASRFDMPYPARSNVICDLVLSDALVEIDAVAVR